MGIAVNKKAVSVGDIRFLGQLKIEVDAVYPDFHIAKIHYVGKKQEFFVDWDALSQKPDATPTISLDMLTENEVYK